MAILNAETGAITFPDGLFLTPGMEPSALEPLYESQRELVLAPRPVSGGQVGALLGMEEGRLAYVLLSAVSARGQMTSARQREYLLGLLGLREPCPDTLSCARLNAPFGSVWMLTQPYTGAVSALIQYDLQEAK